MILKRSKILIILYVCIVAFLVYFVALPVMGTLIYGVNTKDGLSLTMKIIEKSLPYFKNSLVISVIVTVCSTSIGLIMSFALNRINFKGRGIMKVLILLPFINPPFVGSISYIMLFGKRGLISHQLFGMTISAFGLKGILVIQILGLSSLAYLLVSSSIKKIDVTLEDAARNMGASEYEVLRTVTLPLMLPEISGAALLVFLASMADFTTPLVIGGRYQTLASNLYIQITGLYDMTSATISGMLLLLPCVGIFLLHKYRIAKQSYFSEDSHSVDITYKHINKRTKGLLIVISLLFIGMLLIQYLFIIVGAITTQWGYDYTLTLEHIKILEGRKIKPFLNSFKLASYSALIASGIGVVLAYMIKMARLKFATFSDLLATLPAAIPGILFGIGYLVTFKYPILGIGRFWMKNTEGVVLLGTEIIIYLICIARFMSTGLRSGYALLEHVHPDIEKASYNLGAGTTETFYRIMAPLLKDAFYASFLRSFTSGMVTLGAIILLLMPSNKVAVQQIFQIITSSSTGDAAVMALMLSFMTLLCLGGYYLLFYARDIVLSVVHYRERKQ